MNLQMTNGTVSAVQLISGYLIEEGADQEEGKEEGGGLVGEWEPKGDVKNCSDLHLSLDLRLIYILSVNTE